MAEHADPSETTAGWRLRPFREGDEQEMLRVMQAAFPAWPAVEVAVPAIDHLRWKLRSHEQALASHFVVEDGPKVIGSELFLAQRAKIGAADALVCLASDVCVDPAEQGRGVNLAMYNFIMPRLREMYDASLIFRPAYATKRPRREGDTAPVPFANRIHALARPLRPWPSEVRWDKAPRHVWSWARGVLADLRHRPGADRSWRLREVDRFDERVDTLWREASGRFHFIFRRDAERLNWRYADRRAGRFAIRLAEEDGRILGYSVLRVSHGAGHIADLLVVPEREDVLDSLLGDAVDWLRREGADSVECWCAARHPYRDALGRRGFVTRRRTVPLELNIYRPSRAGPSFLHDRHAAIHLMAGDTDLV